MAVFRLANYSAIITRGDRKSRNVDDRGKWLLGLSVVAGVREGEPVSRQLIRQFSWQRSGEGLFRS